jgi:RNA polymerase sigma factor (TIGR02999 family)
MPGPDQRVTLLLDRAATGDRVAAAELLPLVYEQLRASAQEAMRGERRDHTLSATALVHEAYMRLVGPEGKSGATFAGRAHFYGAAAEAMRRYLIDHARARLAQKRGGPGEGHAGAGAPRKPLTELREVADLTISADPEEIVSLDEAVSRLEEEDPQAGGVVRMRFYAGLSVEQTAEILGVSPATVKRDWQFGRAWLFRRLGAR